jgi:hypothetical protein
MKNIIITAILVTIGLIVLSLVGISGGNNPGIEYAPDMYVSKGYEAYTQLESDSFEQYRFGGTMREPVKGSVAVDQMDYVFHYDNSAEGYEKAGAELSMPLISDDNAEGARLYGIYCSMCHGEEGGNDGNVFMKVSSLKPGAWDSYQTDYIRNLSVGKMYHVLTYGKNNMGSHAYALTPMERWRIIKHVKDLSGAGSDETDMPVVESDSTNNQ